MPRRASTAHVFGGTIASQPLVYAHLLDTDGAIDLDHVEVIQSNHRVRLAHTLGADAADRLAGAAPTLVVIFAEALPPDRDTPFASTDLLTPLGRFRASRPVAG